MNIRYLAKTWLTPLVLGFGMMTAQVAAAAVLASATPPSADPADGLTADGTSGAFSQPLSISGHVFINTIRFWGFYQDGNGDLVPASGSSIYTDAFAITLGGSTPVPTTTLVKTVETSPGGDVLTRYEISFADIEFFSAPTSLDIVNNFNDGNPGQQFDASWFWQGIVGGNSRAFEIEGSFAQSVPEPGTGLLLALAVAACWASSTRRTTRK